MMEEQGNPENTGGDFLPDHSSKGFSQEEDYPEAIRWELAKEAVCSHGILQKEAAARYGLSYDALRQRSAREKWPTMEKLSRVVTEKSLNEKKLEMAAETWLEKGEIHRGMAFKVAHKAVKQAMLAPPEVKDWADLERADKMARRAAGLEQETAQQSNSFTFTLVKDVVGVADAVEIGQDIPPEEPAKHPLPE
jgi:hypothetical protein